jgi:hypothetical protein
MVSGIDTVYDLRDEINVLRTKVEIFQPTLDSFGGRLEDIESKISKLESNLGYLIRSINKTNSLFETRMYDIEIDSKTLKKDFGVLKDIIQTDNPE